MLPAAHRLRSAGDFRRTMRRGIRAARPGVVIHAAQRPAGPPDHSDDPEHGDDVVRVGVVVSKAVGGAVQRNRVKRRLRHLAQAQLEATPRSTDWVIRALPPARDAADLEVQLSSAWRQASRKISDVLPPAESDRSVSTPTVGNDPS